MTWKAAVGSTLMLRSGIAYKEHLHFVLNDPLDFAGCPTQSCILVSATTIYPDQKHDDTCVLGENSHPFIKVPSYVPFNFAIVCKAAEIEQLVENGTYRAHEAVGIRLVRHLLTCMMLSPRTSRLHKKFAAQIEKALLGR